ncbi:MAG TPA: alpha/beta hydrolase-fold protein [Flavisolibacter sp.]|nr:alpha/beta hydrolase-fold protein [Flavisolibacter sp.]
MKKLRIIAGLLLFLSCSQLWGQHKVTFVISQLPTYHKSSEEIYLAGSFNSWNPGNEKYRFKTESGHPSISIDLPTGNYEFKVTKGSWDKVESGNNAFPSDNRKIFVDRDTILNISIEHWSDHFPKKTIEHSTSKNVHIIDSVFYIPQLNRTRRIWIYLPPSYTTSRKKYPVLYMQDGQNVFDAATSGFGEWGVDEALDTLGNKSQEMIIVAVDNDPVHRINEYSPYDMEKYGKGEGDAYVDFLVNTLRPYVNKHFRTKKCGSHNYIAGSSMGGLISFYALIKYPKKFGGAGVFSPAFWITPQLKNIDIEKAKKVKGKIYFYAGQQESDSMVPDMLSVFEQMLKHSKAKMKTVIRAQGKHNEATWRAEFPLFYKWLIVKK